MAGRQARHSMASEALPFQHWEKRSVMAHSRLLGRVGRGHEDRGLQEEELGGGRRGRPCLSRRREQRAMGTKASPEGRRKCGGGGGDKSTTEKKNVVAVCSPLILTRTLKMGGKEEGRKIFISPLFVGKREQRRGREARRGVG